MAVDDVYRVTVSARYLGQLFMNDYAFRMKTATNPTLATWQPVVNDLKDIYRSMQPNGLTYTAWTARQVVGPSVSWVTNPCRPTGGLLFQGTFPTSPGGGAGALEILPPQCAIVTTIQTPQAGRRRRGRHYGFAMAESYQADGTWLTAILSPATTAWNSIYAKYAAATGTDPQFEMGVFSFRTASGCIASPGNPLHAHDAPDPSAAFLGTSGYVLRTTVYTQRRRTLGVGR